MRGATSAIWVASSPMAGTGLAGSSSVVGTALKRRDSL